MLVLILALVERAREYVERLALQLRASRLQPIANLERVCWKRLFDRANSDTKRNTPTPGGWGDLGHSRFLPTAK
jgi:hypothetical protein